MSHKKFRWQLSQLFVCLMWLRTGANRGIRPLVRENQCHSNRHPPARLQRGHEGVILIVAAAARLERGRRLLPPADDRCLDCDRVAVVVRGTVPSSELLPRGRNVEAAVALRPAPVRSYDGACQTFSQACFIGALYNERGECRGHLRDSPAVIAALLVQLLLGARGKGAGNGRRACLAYSSSSSSIGGGTGLDLLALGMTASLR